MKSLTKLVLRKSVIVVLACVCGVTAVYFGGQKAEEAVQTLATRPPYEPPTIVLDAGHGGMDGGCTSVNGVSEKGINLEILLHLRAMLQMEGYAVLFAGILVLSFFYLVSFIIKHIQQHDTLNRVFYFILFTKSVLNRLHF